MRATCPICFEELGDKFPPVVLPCGHLYCLDCATFWFNQGDVPQACTSRCPEKYTGDQIIRIWSTTDGNAEGSSKVDWGGIHDVQAEEVLQACLAAASSEDVDDEDVVMTEALSKTETFVERMAVEHDHVGIQRTLQTIRSVLSDIRSLLQQKVQQQQDAQETSAAAATSSRSNSGTNPANEVIRMRVKLQQDIQELLTENMATEEEHERQREELQLRLNETRRLLEHVRAKLESVEARSKSLQDENKQLKKSELRYRKKYYALKQDVSAARRRARGEPDDDSLVVE